jgi:hypothetical protein
VPRGPNPAEAGGGERGGAGRGVATTGFLLLSLTTDLDAALAQLHELGLGGEPRRVEVGGVAMAVVTDPDGVAVELIDTAGSRNLDRLTRPEGDR